MAIQIEAFQASRVTSGAAKDKPTCLLYRDEWYFITYPTPKELNVNSPDCKSGGNNVMSHNPERVE